MKPTRYFDEDILGDERPEREKIVDLSRLEIEGLRMSLGLESPPRSRSG